MIFRLISEFFLAAGAAVVVGRPDLRTLHGPDEGERSSGGGPRHPAVVIGQNPQNQQCNGKSQFCRRNQFLNSSWEWESTWYFPVTAHPERVDHAHRRRLDADIVVDELKCEHCSRG